MREFGSEFNINYARDYFFDNLAKLKPYFSYTRSGREAIALAAAAIGPGVVLMPTYCCWSMELPFEWFGNRVEYYRLNPDLSVDISFLKEQIEKYSPVCVLLVNFFGFVPTRDTAAFIKNNYPSINIIEDFTHSLFNICEIDSNIDEYVASIRKSVGVPDGGLILSSLPLQLDLLRGGESPFVSLHKIAGRQKTCYGYSADIDLKKQFRLVQAEAGQSIKDKFEMFHISDEAKSIVEHTIVDNVRFARSENYKHLYSKISALKGINVLFAPSSDNVAPFMMVILVENRDSIQSVLAKNGVYAQLLWPLKDRAKEICPVSKYMEEHMLALPIDQRYNWDDIEEMGDRIIKVVG